MPSSPHSSSDTVPLLTSRSSSPLSLDFTTRYDHHHGHASDVIQDDVRNKPRSWKTVLWDTYDKPPAERALLWKLDTCLLGLAALGYCIKSLDSTNMTTAYVSGMKEDLGMHKNQYNYAVSMWTIGYVLGQIPSNLLLTRLSPRIWIPFVELVWSLLTLATFRITTVNQLYAMRFFVGLFESAFYPGMQYILGSFYRADELGKRTVIFHSASGIGTMLSGVMQAGAYTYLGGVWGLEGWRWLMILCFLVSAPVSIASAFFLLDMPWKAKPNSIFTAEDLKLANIRLAKEGRAPAEPFTKAKIKRIASSWHIWVMPWLFVFWNNAGGLGQVMPFWLKSFNKPNEPPVFTVPQLNLYPIPRIIIYAISAFTMAWTSDGLLNGKRWPPMLFGSSVHIIVAALLLLTPLYPSPSLLWTRFVLYWLTGIEAGESGLPFAWASEICTADTEERSLVIAAMNDLAYVFQAWVPLLVWKQTDMPAATKGTIYTMCMSSMHVIWTLLVMVLHRRDQQKALKQQNTALEDEDEDTSVLLGQRRRSTASNLSLVEPLGDHEDK